MELPGLMGIFRATHPSIHSVTWWWWYGDGGGGGGMVSEQAV